MIGMSTILKPKYDAVLTCFNAEKTIERALEGILCQTLPASRIIVIDDCSTDGSVELVKSIAQINHRITLVVQEFNNGQSFCRNFGARLSDSNFIVFFDDDDVALSGRALEHARMFEVGAAISYVSSKILYPNGYCVRVSNSEFVSKLDVQELSKKLLLGAKRGDSWNIAVPASTLAVRTDVFEKIGGFDPNLRRLEDVDLALKYSSNGEIFLFSSKELVNRYSTISSDKGRGIDMDYELRLLSRYRNHFSSKEFDFAVKHCRTRELYFSTRYLRLAMHLCKHPIYSIKVFGRSSNPLKRVLHDIKRLAR